MIRTLTYHYWFNVTMKEYHIALHCLFDQALSIRVYWAFRLDWLRFPCTIPLSVGHCAQKTTLNIPSMSSRYAVGPILCCCIFPFHFLSAWHRSTDTQLTSSTNKLTFKHITFTACRGGSIGLIEWIWEQRAPR